MATIILRYSAAFASNPWRDNYTWCRDISITFAREKCVAFSVCSTIRNKRQTYFFNLSGKEHAWSMYAANASTVECSNSFCTAYPKLECLYVHAFRKYVRPQWLAANRPTQWKNYGKARVDKAKVFFMLYKEAKPFYDICICNSTYTTAPPAAGKV